jgi:DNA adenine methylase
MDAMPGIKRSRNRDMFPLCSKPSRREVVSPFRYCGGKFYAIRHIMPFMACVPHDEFREPFVGGGTVFFAKPKATHNWINDLEPELITTYKVMSHPRQRKTLANRLASEIASRERHTEIKEMEATRDLDVAFKTYYLNRTSYSGIIHVPAWGYREGKSSPPENWPNKIFAAGPKLEGVKITTLDFEQVLETPATGKTVLMYLDPPYYWADQRRAYRKPFTEKDHERLAGSLKNSSFHFCLSYDDCDEVRKLYRWANVFEASWIYASADCRNQSRKHGQELVITNYDIDREQSQLRLF